MKLADIPSCLGGEGHGKNARYFGVDHQCARYCLAANRFVEVRILPLQHRNLPFGNLFLRKKLFEF